MMNTVQILEQFNPAGIRDYTLPAREIEPFIDHLSIEDLAIKLYDVIKEKCPRSPRKTESAEIYLKIAEELKAGKWMVPGGIRRDEIKRGSRVEIVLKKDQPTNKLTRGIVKDILSNTKEHKRGIKVRLDMDCKDIYRVGRCYFIERRDEHGGNDLDSGSC